MAKVSRVHPLKSDAAGLTFWLLTLAPALALAGSVKLAPYVSLSQRYSDNINLSATAPASSFVFTVNPGLHLRSKGGRVSYDVDYGLDSLYYTNSTGGNTLNHTLNFSSRAELLEDRLMLLLSARAHQQNTSLTGAKGGSDALTSGLSGGNAGSSTSYYQTNNKSKIRSMSVQPIWRERFGPHAQLEVSLQNTVTQTDSGAGVTRSVGNNLNLGLASGPSNPRLPWSLRYSQQTTGTGGASTRLSTTSANLSYVPSAKLRYSLAFGQDSNDGSTSGLTSSEGPYWSLGVGWAPSNRLSLDASAGRRRNSTSYGLNATYRHRRFSAALRYSESLQDSYAEVNSIEAFDLYTCPDASAPIPVAAGSGAPAAGCTLVLAAILAQVPRVTNLISLSRSWSGNASYRLGSGLFTVALSSTRRDLVGSAIAGEQDQSTALTGAWSQRLGPRMASILSLSRSSATSNGLNSSDSALTWSLTRNLAPDAVGAIDLRHMERGAGSSTGAYSENSFSTRINMNF
jgi:uncharacterized protein (PEP-CTERM system associated)